MKILIVTSRYYPETFSITNIAEQFVKMGHSVTVLTGVPHYGLGKIYDGYENVYNQTINGVKIFRIKEHIRRSGTISLILNYLSIFRNFKKSLSSYLKNEEFDVVISHVLSPIFTMRGLGKFCKKRKIPLVHYGLDLWPESMAATNTLKKNSIFFKILKKYCTKLYRQCDYITFSSPSAQVYFQDYLGLKEIPFKHIYQPCLSIKPSIEKIKEHQFLEDGKLHILYCGTVAKFHRLDIFFQGLRDSKYKNRIIFDVVGSGSELEHIKQLVNENNMDSIVKFHGRVSVKETVEYYLKADVLFVPLIYNCATSLLIPQKVIEYFMYGKPILGMLKGDGAKLIKQSSSDNILCDQTSEEITNSLNNLIENYDRKRLRDCGIDNRLFFDNNKEFTLDYICQQLIVVCKELIR